jgi:predicted nucleic acid-binding protein
MKTLINLEDDLIGAAQRLLGASTKTYAVNSGLRELLRQQAVNEYLALATGEAPTGRYLLDRSAIRRLAHRPAAERVAPLIAAGLVATCAVVDLDLFADVSDAAALVQISGARSRAFGWLPTLDADMRRALAVQAELLAADSRISWPALIVAAVAEREQVTVMYHESGFDLIAKLTGQPMERLP